MTETLRSGCKVNLFLDITGVLPGGKHELHSLFWPLAEPHDELFLRAGQKGEGLRVRCDAPEVDSKKNTLITAWSTFADSSGFAPNLELELHKGVPMGGGLGGGSANAAVLLLWLNQHAPKPISEKRLVKAALSVGADVPFFLFNRPALAKGVGEVLQPFPYTSRYAGLWIVLVSPPFSVSTGAAFRAFDVANADFPNLSASQTLTKKTSPAKQTASETTFDRSSLIGVGPEKANSVRNSLEAVVFAMYPELSRQKTELARTGAAAVGMSGSGSTLFGLFRTEALATMAAKAMKQSARVWVQRL